ncbi:dUTP diphosphatase [Gammaproteobacteria bacterium 53_120_T64]|nr:dUTP diphosphatase [Gammaproteobacteria bacterium 53_120_T64]
MKSRLNSMLDLQDAMNRKVNPDWREQGFPWYRAIWVECAELLDHYGWKWWKHQQPDMEQVKLELIDIWHFGLSQLLLGDKDPEAVADKLVEVFSSVSESGGGALDFRDQLETFTLSTLGTRDFNPTEFALLLQTVDLSFDELYTRYIGKNVLNFFRQDHGYQEGTYRKVWAGREDNEHLVELSGELDSNDPGFKDAIYAGLAARYKVSAD